MSSERASPTSSDDHVANNNDSVLIQLLNADDGATNNYHQRILKLSPSPPKNLSRDKANGGLDKPHPVDYRRLVLPSVKPEIVMAERDAATMSALDQCVAETETSDAETMLTSSGGRRNKRKMTEPRRRATTDFSIRSICSPSNSDVDVDNDDDDDARDNVTWSTPTHDVKRLGLEQDTTAARLNEHSTDDRIRHPFYSMTSSSSLPPTTTVLDRTKPFLFYPLNIPMVYCAAAAAAGRNLPYCSPFAAAALASAAATGSSMFYTSGSETAAAAKSCGDHVSPSNDVDNNDIPSPTKDDQQERRVRIRNDVINGVGVPRRPILPVDVLSRRRRRREVVSVGRQTLPAAAATVESASSPEAVGSDGSPDSSLLPPASRQPQSLRRAGVVTTSASAGSASLDDGGRAGSPSCRKNYKNMTKQRRIEANARERTRVHTISAAFESLRRAVPSYSYNQRLSKLAILRIACSYILALARLADLDYAVANTRQAAGRSDGRDGKTLTFAECVDLCTQTIQTEGKAKRRHC